jgi:hypothetical protein
VDPGEGERRDQLARRTGKREEYTPLLPLASLSTDVENPILEISRAEGRLSDTRGLLSTPEDVLIRGNIGGGEEAV